MGCGMSKSQQHGPECACCQCCTCCACCIQPPSRAVLYGEDILFEEHLHLQPPITAAQKQCNVSATASPAKRRSSTAGSNWQDTASLPKLDLPCLALARGNASAMTPAADKPAASRATIPNGNTLNINCSSCETPVFEPGRRSASGSPSGNHSNHNSHVNLPETQPPCIQSDVQAIPGLDYCLNAGVNTSQPGDLKAHLQAKGFPVDNLGSARNSTTTTHEGTTVQLYDNPLYQTVEYPASQGNAAVDKTQTQPPTQTLPHRQRWDKLTCNISLQANRPLRPASAGNHPQGASGQTVQQRVAIDGTPLEIEPVSVSRAVSTDNRTQPNAIAIGVTPRPTLLRTSDWSCSGMQDAHSQCPPFCDNGCSERNGQWEVANMLDVVRESSLGSMSRGETAGFDTASETGGCIADIMEAASMLSEERNSDPGRLDDIVDGYQSNPNTSPAMRSTSFSKHGYRNTSQSGMQKQAAGGSRLSREASVHQAQGHVTCEDQAHGYGLADVHPAVAAYKNGTLGWAFSGGGFFFAYHVGCVIQLKEMGIITDRTPLAGASCGSIIVACVNSGVDLHANSCLEFAADCRTWGTAGRLRSVTEKFMTANLPADAHQRCSGRTFISVTKVFPYMHPQVISEYNSKEDLVAAIATSCHIPAYADGSFLTRFRGQWFVDGGLVRHIPLLPPESGATYTAGVSCVPFKFLDALPGVSRLQLLHTLEVSPDMFHKFPFSWHEVGRMVLTPAEDDVLLQMVEMGKQDILAWSQAVGLTHHITRTHVIPPAMPPADIGTTHIPPTSVIPEPLVPSTVVGEIQYGPASQSVLNNSINLRRTSHASHVTYAYASAVESYHDHTMSLPSSVQTADHSRTSLAVPSASHTLSTASETGVRHPGVLLGAEDDDWHDAVDQQYNESLHAAMQSLHEPGHLADGERSRTDVVETAVQDGVTAAMEVAHGPLHMDMRQAVEALGGTSALGLATLSAQKDSGHSSEFAGSLRGTALHEANAKLATAVDVIRVLDVKGGVCNAIYKSGVQGPEPAGHEVVLEQGNQPVVVSGDMASLSHDQVVTVDIALDKHSDDNSYTDVSQILTMKSGTIHTGENNSSTRIVQLSMSFNGKPLCLNLRLHE